MKHFALLLAAVFLTIILFGCGKADTQQITADESDPIKNYDKTELYTVDNVKDAFSVSTKKLNGSDGEVIILHVVNKTDTDYDLTVKGSFNDNSNGNTENRTVMFKGFSAGADNYFFFENKEEGKEFSFDLEATPSISEAFLSCISVGSVTTEAHSIYDLLTNRPYPVPKEKMDQMTDLDLISATIIMTFLNAKRANITGEVVFFRDDKYICKSSFTFGQFIGEQEKDVGFPQKALKDGDSYVIPDICQGELTYVVSILTIEPVE